MTSKIDIRRTQILERYGEDPQRERRRMVPQQ
jgi:hypothetical protein